MEGTGMMAPESSARATMRDASGAIVGQVQLSMGATGVRVVGDLTGLAPGTHGLHLHAVGRCDAPDFQSAGPHFNPMSKQHGFENPQGAHAGDLRNVTVGVDGRARIDEHPAMFDTVRTMIFDTDGASLVVHTSADDYRTDPAGNSGARIACGVLAKDSAGT